MSLLCFGPAGVLGIVSFRKRTCVISAYITMSVFSAIFAFYMMIIGAIGAPISESRGCNAIPCKEGLVESRTASDAIMSVIGLIELIVAIVGSVYGCSGVCCTPQSSRPLQGFNVVNQYPAIVSTHQQGLSYVSTDQPPPYSTAQQQLQLTPTPQQIHVPQQTFPHQHTNPSQQTRIQQQTPTPQQIHVPQQTFPNQQTRIQQIHVPQQTFPNQQTRIQQIHVSQQTFPNQQTRIQQQTPTPQQVHLPQQTFSHQQIFPHQQTYPQQQSILPQQTPTAQQVHLPQQAFPNQQTFQHQQTPPQQETNATPQQTNSHQFYQPLILPNNQGR
ncbi:gamma-gliadin-like isoform X1 [Strongylocentrotus purpuratus]|uniref:Uncharacterized protein n=1 Tax=Strongylocentrotus purpuratus TaxID=7668 RepID=A0A7M7N3N5_STRPU|nr:gamma-gliadin-like isoform X1 [Strongylocentrotus purpuratus]